ncbi:MAG: efflux RND transporter periplasmic adaptor subunit [Pseudomonadota bacterium]
MKLFHLCVCVAAAAGLLPVSQAVSQEASDQLRPAALITVQSMEDASERVFFGRVRARETVDLAFQVGGQILELPVDEGQLINEGDLIAELDLEPFELSLLRAEAEEAQAQLDFDRFSSLSDLAVTQATIDEAETALQLSRIETRNAQRDLRLATLRSPFEGIVASRTVPNFTTINAGTSVVRLHDMSDLRVEIEVPEVLFQQAGRDPNVALQVEFAANDRRYDIEFREVVAETTQVGQSFRLTLGMEPPDDLFVLPGASATVYARMRDQLGSLVVPPASLVFDPNGAASVMVFEPTGAESGSVRRQPIEIGSTGSGAVQVLSGLEEGQEIVASGAALLRDGDQVTRFSGFVR